MSSQGARAAHARRQQLAPQRKPLTPAQADGQRRASVQPADFAQDAHLIARSSAAPPGEGAAAEAMGRWDAALGNLEDARVALDVIAKAIDDAVYLDEDAFRQVAPVAQYARQLQVWTL
jgi:hypothetical protein